MSDDDYPSCTLTAGSACYCTSRPGCQMAGDDGGCSCGDPECRGDCDDTDDAPGDWPPGTVTIDTKGLL